MFVCVIDRGLSTCTDAEAPWARLLRAVILLKEEARPYNSLAISTNSHSHTPSVAAFAGDLIGRADSCAWLSRRFNRAHETRVVR